MNQFQWTDCIWVPSVFLIIPTEYNERLNWKQTKHYAIADVGHEFTRSTGRKFWLRVSQAVLRTLAGTSLWLWDQYLQSFTGLPQSKWSKVEAGMVFITWFGNSSGAVPSNVGYKDSPHGRGFYVDLKPEGKECLGSAWTMASVGGSCITNPSSLICTERELQRV